VKQTFVAHALIALATSCLAACGGSDSAETGDEEHLDEGPKLAFDEYRVLFTNPVCKKYAYGPDQNVTSEGGEKLLAKPENVFCSHFDSAVSGNRPESPQFQLLEWIKDPATTEIFFTYLSYSNSAVTKELCKAISERDVKVTFIIDSSSDRAKADELLACKSKTAENAPRFEMRGHEGGIGFAHNKIFIVNPNADKMRIAFSSGNMSSGVVLHHENWHFITLPSKTFFAQEHICVMNAELDHHASKSEYRASLNECRAAIPFKEESDIKAFFAPADGSRASTTLMNAVKTATSIDVAAHRFSYTTLVKALGARLSGSKKPKMRIVTDDDTWWAGHGHVTGDNQSFEYWNIKGLTDQGAEVKWMETNHGEHLLHHNKYLILNQSKSGGPSAVFGGAGNLTGTAFNENWENFYYITIPEVVEQFRKQYDHVWNDLGTDTNDLPSEDILPPLQ